MRDLGISLLLAVILSASTTFAAPLRDVAASEWQPADSEASYVRRLRQNAEVLGESCAVDDAAAKAVASSTAVVIPDSGTAGAPFQLDWQTQAKDQSTPIWLVASFDRSVRFSGEGFYALTPTAIGPFGIAAGKGKTRALIPLFGPEARTEGSITVIPLEAGPLDIKVAVAGYARRCGEETATGIASTTVDVATSRDAVFLVRDPFSFEVPRSRLASPNALTSVDVYEGRYRLVETATGAVLVDREGERPRYSPTGRYVSARSGEGSDVIDTIDGTLVAQVQEGDIGWENADSFLVNGEPDYGAVDLLNPLVDGYRLTVGETLLGCSACSGLETRLKIDLENDTAIRIGGQGYALSRLSSRSVVFGPVDAFDEEITAEADRAMAAYFAAMGSAPASIPLYWNFRGGLTFSSFDADAGPTGQAEFDTWQRAIREAVVPAVEAAKAEPPDRQALQVNEIGRWRGAVRLTPPRARSDALPTRLDEFGLTLAQPMMPSFSKQGPLDEQADMAIARRISEAVPMTANVFSPMESFGCLPETSAGDDPRIFGYFNNALEFKVAARTLWLTLFSCKWTAGGAFEPNFYLFDSALARPIRLGDDNPGQPNTGRCDANIAYCGIEARLFLDRYLLIWSKQSRALLLYNIEENRPVFRQFDVAGGDLLKEAYVTAAGTHVVQVNDDGAFHVYDMASQEAVLTGRYVDDEVIVWSRDLRFDASPEGANYVNLRFPGQPGQYTFQQFSRAVRKPGLVQAVLSGAFVPATAPVSVPPAISGQIAMIGSRIVGDIDTRGATEVRVYQDGLRTHVLPVPDLRQHLNLDVPHAPGARWVSVVAAGKDGIVSLPVGRNFAGSGGALPTVHLLTVGVDRYDADELTDLGFAGKDARTLFEAVGGLSGKTLRLGMSAELSDARVSPSAILSWARRTVDAAKPGETIVISFAGHGLAGQDGRFYMATAGTVLSDLAGTALSWEALAAILVESQARVVVFLDACHSGIAGTGLSASNDDAAAGMLDTIPSGLLVFSASKGRQFSEEMASAGGGVFTNAVADVIARNRGAYDLDGNGVVEVSELYAGVKRRVSEITQGRQVPWLARNEMIGDFSLF